MGLKAIKLTPHELHANLLFGAEGLATFFALDATVKAAEGSRTDTLALQGEQWQIRLSYQDSNIVFTGPNTPNALSSASRPSESTG